MSATLTTPGIPTISDSPSSIDSKQITINVRETTKTKDFVYNALVILSILILACGFGLLIYYVAYKGQTATSEEEIKEFNKKYYWIGLGSFGSSLVLVLIIGYIAARI